MHETINLFLILSTAFVVTCSPGVSSLAIAGASMHGGRQQGVAIAIGITLGSWMWSAGAAFGLAAVMTANVWIFEAMRYAGAVYLLYLAFRSARSAWQNVPVEVRQQRWDGEIVPEILRGFLIHLTNPKVILFFASVYATGVPSEAAPRDLALIVILVGLQSTAIFAAYVFAFSCAPVVRVYTRLSRFFDMALAAMFFVFAISLFLSTLPAA